MAETNESPGLAWSSVLRNDPTSFESSFGVLKISIGTCRSLHHMVLHGFTWFYLWYPLIASGSTIKDRTEFKHQTTVQSSISIKAIGIRIFTRYIIIGMPSWPYSWLKLTECPSNGSNGRPLPRKGGKGMEGISFIGAPTRVSRMEVVVILVLSATIATN